MKRAAALNGDVAPREMARLAGLKYVSDSEPGFRRNSRGAGFVYVDLKGKRLTARERKRVKQLAIPPAWTDVWICAYPLGHLQATGYDDRGRKQYLYHDRWRQVADLAKFARLAAFGIALPLLRRSTARHLNGRDLTRRRVLAGMVALLDTTSIRIGNEEYVRENGSYGLTTLRSRHVKFGRGRAHLRFRAKGGQRRDVVVADKKLVRLLRQLHRLPGAYLFQYPNGDNNLHHVTSADVNSYLSEMTGHTFTAKDFRTWNASALAAGKLLRETQDQPSGLNGVSEAKHQVRQLVAKLS